MKNALHLASLGMRLCSKVIVDLSLIRKRASRVACSSVAGNAQASTFTPRQKAIYPAIRRAPSFGSG
jgi:hypothetical protein